MTSRVRSHLRLTVLAGLTVCLCLLGAGAAAAETITFLPTGGEQTFTVPAGVTSIHMVAVGGRGGDGQPNSAGPAGPGGFGAIVSGDIAVKPGEVLYVEVGGNGAKGTSGGAGGFNGGGAGGDASEDGGGGGGASDVRLVPRAAGTSISSRLIVAGGGGGGGGGHSGTSYTNEGGHGGSPATGGSGGSGGGPGTTTAAGEGPCSEGDGGPGLGGLGGTYDRCGYMGYGGGGGGGGGLFGGGGGAFSSIGDGGGAGSSGFAPGVVTNTSIGTDTTGAPAISLSFTASAPPGQPPVTPSLNPPPLVSDPVLVLTKCVVPKLAGRKLRGARKGLAQAHCKLGKVHHRNGGGEQGAVKRVVGQSAKPGATLPAGSAVNVTLSA